MNVIKVPASGRLLVAQLAAYGLAAAIERSGAPVWVGHDPDSLELTALVMTELEAAAVLDAVRASAAECEDAVERDLSPGTSGNNRIPVIRARATDAERAVLALQRREELLDELDGAGSSLAARLIAGLGAPAPWVVDPFSREKRLPAWGATRLDGVPYNIGADIVRSALRPGLAAARDLDNLLTQAPGDDEPGHAEDRFRWSPPRSALPAAWQWLAGLGLTLLPVGLAGRGRSRTPAFWDRRARGEGTARGVTLPVLADPVSLPRLRALLQTAELADDSPGPAARERLKRLGITALAIFVVRDGSTGTMVQFFFEPAERIDL